MRSPGRQGVPTRLLVPLLAILLPVLLSVLLLPGTASAASSGPPLTVPLDELRRAVSCDGGALAGRRTVLLIHGTGATPEEAWSWNYQRALPAAGYGVCTVRLPERALADFTLSAEYAVHAAREAYRVSGRKIAILGHSQGGLMTAWIAKFWPDVARHSTDVLSLAGPMHGTALANTLCAAGACAPIAWQMRMGSHVTNAASNAPLPTSTSFTSIGSLDDEVVFPQPVASHLAGARNVMVQGPVPGPGRRPRSPALGCGHLSAGPRCARARRSGRPRQDPLRCLQRADDARCGPAGRRLVRSYGDLALGRPAERRRMDHLGGSGPGVRRAVLRLSGSDVRAWVCPARAFDLATCVAYLA